MYRIENIKEGYIELGDKDYALWLYRREPLA